MPKWVGTNFHNREAGVIPAQPPSTVSERGLTFPLADAEKEL